MSVDLRASVGESVTVIGITMLKVMPGHEKSVYGLLREMDGIKDVYHLFGEFDFFVIMQAEGMKALDKLAKNLRHLEAVTSAWHMLVTRDGGPLPSETHRGGSRTYIQDDYEAVRDHEGGLIRAHIGELDAQSECEPCEEPIGGPDGELGGGTSGEPAYG